MSRCLLASDAFKIFNAAVTAALPNTMIKSVLRCNWDSISVFDKKYMLKGKTVYMVGFGKAVIGMARAVQDVLKDIIEEGIIIVPHGTLHSLEAVGRLDLIPEQHDKLQIFEGARNNLPDSDSQKAANKILDLVKSMCDDNILLVLVSGGGSALLSTPMPPVTLDEKKQLTSMLSNCGANIQELNVVRKHLSLSKGGKLAKLAAPAQVISLILSDIIGDPLDQIASGPTIRSSSEDPLEALSIIRKYNLEERVSPSVITVLSSATCPVVSDATSFDHVDNFLIGNNEIAINAASVQAGEAGFRAVSLSSVVCGEARDFGMAVAKLSRLLVDHRLSVASSVDRDEVIVRLARHGVKSADLQELFVLAKECNRLAIITSGETVVNVIGGGVGGRNQETALACSLALSNLFSVQDMTAIDLLFVSAGTDGIDGPTDCAGAMAYIGQMHAVKSTEEVIPEGFLDKNDSNTFFKRYLPQDLIVTGITGTNVMDVHVLLLNFKLDC